MAHKLDLDLRRRSDMLLACSEVQSGRAIPDGGERETEGERAAREARLVARQASAEAKRSRDGEIGARERQKAISQGRGIYLNAAGGAGTEAETYLRRRVGAGALPDAIWENLRFAPAHSYWHGKDARGHDVERHCGPALIAPLVDLDGRVTGCHQTWIDLAAPPKLRPALRDDAGAPLPAKKMRGHKKGSLIPVLGDLDRGRWVVGEGIETVLAVARFEGWRADTFYAAAGDIGNIAGPADPESAFSHPELRRQDAKGRWKPVRVAGPVPKPESAGEAFGLPPHVTALVLLADGDSEFVATASAMARAEARLGRDGLDLATWWPPAGGDWADLGVRISELEGEAA
ncbi:MAG TPA: P4 alpha zinc-binding domain-containing protein [Alphaproteobacteria bacterium]|nr:P4 alpha zinc-binding domain-containing protein [Alphaproteobacteria bacterium]